MTIITGRWWDGLTDGLAVKTLTQTQTIGQLFAFNLPWQITEIGWYRGNTTGDKPERLMLGINARGPMVVVEDAPDDGTVGWQWVSIDPVAGTVANAPYLEAHAGPGTAMAWWPAEQDTPDYKVGQAAPNSYQSRSSNGRVWAGASGVSSIEGYAVDVGYRLNTLADAPDFNVDVEAELARWLSEAGDHYNDSRLPFIAGQAAGANETVKDATFGLEAILNQLGPDGTHTVFSWLNEINARALEIKSGNEEIDAALEANRVEFAIQFADVLERVGEYTGISLLDYAAVLIRWVNGVNAPPQLAEGDDWELLGETDFTNSLLWPVEADVYRVNLTAFDPAGTSEPFGALERHGYLIKWTPVNVEFTQQWQFANTTKADLFTGRRMPGLGLILYRPGAGHVQAWRRKEAP